MRPSSTRRLLASPQFTLDQNTHRHGHAALRNAFDAFPSKSSIASSRRSTGRFRYDSLRRPSDFIALTKRVQLRADAIVNRMLAYTSSTTSTTTTSDDDRRQKDLLVQVKQIDRLSDLLCGVIDLAELVRNLDPDPQWVGQADRAYGELCYYMNQLNTHVGLYEALKRVYDPVARSASTSSSLFPALTVASQFLSDFEKSGIHLPDSQRHRFVSLSDEILSLGRTFTTPPSTDDSSSTGKGKMVSTTYEELSEWNPRLANSSNITRGGGGQSVYLHADSTEAQSLRREHPRAEVRKKFYEASYKGVEVEERVEVLEGLLRKRGELARLVGRKNWGEVALGDKMAKTPENVMSFLTSLSDRNRPLALRDLSQLSSAKASHLSLPSSSSSSPSIEAWDRDYYYSLAINRFSPSSPHPATLAPYFSVGNCIAGLSALFQNIYGIHFEIEDTLPGETWLTSSSSSESAGEGKVQKLAVIDEVEGKIGEIYCDLFARLGKPNGAAHFTVRCSRRLDDDDSSLDLAYMTEQAKMDYLSLGELEELPLKQEKRKLKGRMGEHQLPLVVLTCDFELPEKGRPGLLNWQEVETLFHEMGHAMHSMIGRTDYHNVAGTRCATDLVELPSILMEHFASSSSVLSLFASHYKTSAPLPLHLLRQMQNTLKGFSALESNSQIMMAVLDQKYHSDAPLHEGFDSTETYQMIQREYGVIKPAKGAAWQTNFGHLFGYGATYYSYLFDRAIASRVFSKLFADNPLSRESGEKYKEELLRHGGGRDPWACVGAVLGEKELMKGDKAAMDAVGSWNVDQ